MARGSHRLGVDIGGTFTDFALYEEAGGAMAIHKQLTTPDDPSRAVLEGTAALLSQNGLDLGAVSEIVHGTTLVTNAVIERKGAVTGMLTTRGFRDILDMRQEKRYDVFDLRLVFPDAIVPRRRRREVDERCHYDGRIEVALDLDAARGTLHQLVEEQKIEALAICLLHSYANPAHEQALGEMAAVEFPQLPVSLSSQVCPEWREYERFTTTTINAFTQPMFDQYLRRLETGLSDQGFGGRLFVMSSSGGTLTPATARRHAHPPVASPADRSRAHSLRFLSRSSHSLFVRPTPRIPSFDGPRRSALFSAQDRASSTSPPNGSSRARVRSAPRAARSIRGLK